MNIIFDWSTIGLMAMTMLMIAEFFLLLLRKDRAAFVCIVLAIIIMVMEVMK